jgi:sulfide dehydrogenase cytochrome subunit
MPASSLALILVNSVKTACTLQGFSSVRRTVNRLFCPNLEEDMKKSLAITLLLAGTLGAVSAQAIDTKARFMAANCAYCHGPEGKSRGAIPSLAGLEQKYFVEQMKAFRDGSRPATVMQKHAMGYTDAEFEQLGAWFSAIK